MNVLSKKFQLESGNIAFDLRHRKIIRFNMSKYDSAVEKGKSRYLNLELARQRASAIKEKVVQHLDEYLLQFEERITQNGAKVIFAKNEFEAIGEIALILKKHSAKLIVKSKSMTTEEIEFNESFVPINVESLETDLGEYIVQIAGEKPYHIVTPAMHKSKEDIAALFHDKFGTAPNSSPEELTLFVRNLLREKYQQADVGVTGANFLIADIGGISVTENEGNALMSTSFPKVHIVIAGIEKILPSIHDLPLFLPLLAAHGTGQQISAYNTIFTGPRKQNEIDGPEEMYIVLLDNGRTNLLNLDEQHKALKCIRCGACLNACPVYRNIGGYTYNATYSGPIGAVITPHLKGLENYKHLSFASSLCGKCTEVCPVKIELHKHLLQNRRDSVNAGFSPFSEKVAMNAYRKLMLNRSYLDIANEKLKNAAAQTFAKKVWGKNRNFPRFGKSFSQQWKTKINKKNIQ